MTDAQSPSRSSRRHALHYDQAGWTPALGSISDEPPTDHAHRPSPPISVMHHTNRSVPSLPSDYPPHYQDHPPLPTRQQYDPTLTLDNFSALSITAPTAHQVDPPARTPSSMSMRSLQTHRLPFQPRHALTLPSGLPYHPQDPLHDHVHSDASSGFHQQSEGYDADRSIYTSDHSDASPVLFQDHYPSHWKAPHPVENNTLYAAASSVLGMAPPTSGSISSGSPPEVSHYYQPTGQIIYTNSASSDGFVADDTRPPLHRTGTSALGTLSSQKSKAVDLTSPPYTKEYIDQYRQRIKVDPDPEAHFLFAKYLIDAAKHIRNMTQDQRAAKKYSELLIGESLKVVRRLATQGDPYAEAQFFLANCHGSGALGLQIDHERAYHLYLQAAKQNHAAASYRVAVCNDMGIGTKKEASRAAAFYRKAASLGDTPAMYKLGMILLHGLLDQQKNPRESIGWLKRAAEQADEDNPHALHELGLLHEVPGSQLVPYDPAYAKSLFTQAAQLGYTASQFKLGQCYEYGSLTCPIDPRRSIAWYTKAAEKGYAEAELALSGWYLTGSEGVLKQSDSEAYLWARRAANKGLSKAEYAVGYYAEVGIGIKQDIDFARKWYMRAAAQGNKRAMNRLTEMKRMGNKRTNIARPTRQEAKDECVIS